MKSLESVKNLYEKSDEMIIVTDTDLSVIWKSNSSLPDFISLSAFMQEFGNAPSMPTSSSKILHYIDGRSVKVIPLFDDDSIEGYMMTFFDADEIETLSDRSSLLNYKQNSIGNIRLAISPFIAQIDNLRRKNNSKQLDTLYKSISSGVLNMLSSTVNSIELTKYYSGEFSTELLNISNCLDQTAANCRQTLNDKALEFSADIEPMIFMNMNYERLENAVANLLINGYMYCDAPHKKLSLKLYKLDNRIFIEVFDNGQSADIALLKEALRPFRPLQKFGKGEMLGLSVVQKFAEHFNGELYFIKNDDGLTVSLSFSAEISEAPKSFRLVKNPPVFGGFEPVFCILAKGTVDK